MEDTVKTAEPDTAPRKFLFEESFDVERTAARKRKAEEEKPPEPTFSKEELETARRDGYDEGHAAGAREAASGLEATTAQLIDAIGRQLPVLSADQAKSNDRLMHDGARVATTITRKILPTYAAQHGIDELTTLVTRCLQTLVSQPKIVVRVEPSQVAPITEHLEAAASASGFDGRFLVEADEGMGPSDCRLMWQGGGLERCEADIWREIDAAIDDYLGATPNDECAEPQEPESDTPSMDADSSADTESEPATDAADDTNDGAEIPTPADAGSEPTNAPAEIPADMPDPLEDR